MNRVIKRFYCSLLSLLHIADISLRISQELRMLLTLCCSLMLACFYPYPSGLHHSHWDNDTIIPVPMKQSLWHYGQCKIAAISQTTFSNVFSWKNMYEFRLRFHWNLFLKIRINNIPALVQIMTWCQIGDKPLTEPNDGLCCRHIYRYASLGLNELKPPLQSAETKSYHL